MNNTDTAPNMSGRAVVVTGGASGIGKAIAEAFTSANGDRSPAVLDRRARRETSPSTSQTKRA